MSTNAPVFAQGLRQIADQIPYALALGVNRTAEDIQRAQVEHMHRVFQVRVPHFIGTPATAHQSAIRRTQKAEKGRPVAELAVLPPGGRARADILTRHEDDPHRLPRGRSLAVPTDNVRRGKNQLIPKAQRPKGLALQEWGQKGNRRVFKGDRRTFLIESPAGATIYQRVGRRRGKRGRRVRGSAPGSLEGTRVLWQLVRQTGLDQRLEFVNNARKVFEERMAPRFQEAFEHAMRTAL